MIVAAEVFDPANFPKEKDDLAGYGVKEIGVLLKHFKNVLEAQGCDTAAVAREWTQLKLAIFCHFTNESFTNLWKRMLTKKRILYLNVLHLVHIILVMPWQQLRLSASFLASREFWEIGGAV